MTLEARCANCASWRLDPSPAHATIASGYCMRGLAPEPGAILCAKYEASARFKQEIISGILKEHGPMAMPVKLVGGRKSARSLRRR